MDFGKIDSTFHIVHAYFEVSLASWERSNCLRVPQLLEFKQFFLSLSHSGKLLILGLGSLLLVLDHLLDPVLSLFKKFFSLSLPSLDDFLFLLFGVINDLLGLVLGGFDDFLLLGLSLGEHFLEFLQLVLLLGIELVLLALNLILSVGNYLRGTFLGFLDFLFDQSFSVL